MSKTSAVYQSAILYQTMTLHPVYQHFDRLDRNRTPLLCGNSLGDSYCEALCQGAGKQIGISLS
jgi:hypothetical protein